MSARRMTLSSALKDAHREEVRAASFLSAASAVRNPQLHGTFLQFGSQEMGGIATVEGLLDTRGVGRPMMLALTRVRAALQGRAARARPWRALVEDALDRSETRATRMAEAASNARAAGDVDAARSLDGLSRTATAQATWFRDFLR